MPQRQKASPRGRGIISCYSLMSTERIFPSGLLTAIESATVENRKRLVPFLVLRAVVLAAVMALRLWGRSQARSDPTGRQQAGLQGPLLVPARQRQPTSTPCLRIG
jgi:hypothetical protein